VRGDAQARATPAGRERRSCSLPGAGTSRLPTILNPLTFILEEGRKTLIHGQMIDWLGWLQYRRRPGDRLGRVLVVSEDVQGIRRCGVMTFVGADATGYSKHASGYG
jgi:hypothetical protein